MSDSPPDGPDLLRGDRPHDGWLPAVNYKQRHGHKKHQENRKRRGGAYANLEDSLSHEKAQRKRYATATGRKGGT
jgi:hypothetical protein